MPKTDKSEQIPEPKTLFVDELRVIFAEKLLKERDLDAAFTKAVWVAFKHGVEVGRAER